MKTRRSLSVVLIGAFAGLTWGASLRSWMTLLALQFGDRPSMSWSGTFLNVLMPAMLVGGILGMAYHTLRSGGSPKWRWAILSPLLLAVIPAILIPDFIPTLLSTGLGGGAILVTLIGLLGGYAFSGIGPRWGRILVGLTVVGFAIFGIVNFYFGGSSPTGRVQPEEVFGVLYFFSLMIVLAVGIAFPFRDHSPNNVKN